MPLPRARMTDKEIMKKMRVIHRRTQKDIKDSIPPRAKFGLAGILAMDREVQAAIKARYQTVIKPCRDCGHPEGEHNYNIATEGECAEICAVCFAKAHVGEATK